jgi:SWI/SNF-related matrix-associated actin-dependent regulator of chromatin subfamily A member 5
MQKSLIYCSQHNCAVCQRNTSQSGGMLFRCVRGLSVSVRIVANPMYRCQTCPQAFCEDCLPEGDIDAIGDVLPEL